MNGYIQSKIIFGATTNEHGEPVSGHIDFGEKRECRYKPNMKRSNGKYQDGVFTQSEYEITVFDMNFSASEIRLLDKNGSVVCEKPVLSVQELESVQRVKIIV